MLTHFAAALQDVARLAEKREPAEIAAILNDYRDLMHETVEAEHGFVDRLLGDQLSAVWGGIQSQSPSQAAVRACKAALRQVRALAAYNARTGRDLRLNIGIASGEPALCAALVKLCASRQAVILVSQSTREQCPEILRFVEREPLELEGALVRVFELKEAGA